MSFVVREHERCCFESSDVAGCIYLSFVAVKLINCMKYANHKIGFV